MEAEVRWGGETSGKMPTFLVKEIVIACTSVFPLLSILKRNMSSGGCSGQAGTYCQVSNKPTHKGRRSLGLLWQAPALNCYMKERKKYNLFKLLTNNISQAKLVGFFCQKAFLTGLASLKENFTRLLQTVLFYSVAPQVWRQSAEKNLHWTFLVDQWLRICLPRQGTRVWSLAWGDSTCHGATKPVSHNYWACMLQLVKPCT